MSLPPWPAPLGPLEGFIPLENARLFYREIGQGQPVIVLHGGPDFDHTYLLPDTDRLARWYRLIYYDQRGRGRSAAGVRPEDVSLGSDVEDLESLRAHFRLESVALLGHSWGGLLAMEYALRHPQRVSHLILVNTAPASHSDYLFFRRELPGRRTAADLEKLSSRPADPRYQQGDPAVVAEYYRSHFRATLRQPEHLERLIQSLRSSFTREGVLKARAIEERLMEDTWLSGTYDLLPQLEHLRVPTLLIHGEHDFIPLECAAHIAEAIPNARLTVLRGCGHFAYMEAPEEFLQAIRDFFAADDRQGGKSSSPRR